VSDYLINSTLWLTVLLFMLAGVLIAVFGIRMTHLARDLAVATGLGQAFMGAVFIGATTSLSGIIASATAAWFGDASLAVSNSLGGIAAQTVFLVLADMVYRKANLEFAAASAENLMMSVQLLLLLCLLNLAFIMPDYSVGAVHPLSILMVIVYLFGVRLLADVHEKPMWLPRLTPGTERESRKLPQVGIFRARRRLLFLDFGVCAAVVGGAGWLAATAGLVLVQKTDVSAGIMGGVFIAIVTSLPELVVAITAVRLGALSLAVGDIIGGNAFDTLFVAVADLFYRDGPIYRAVEFAERVWLGACLLMVTVLLVGLMYRERKGIANIGLESLLILLLYLFTVGLLTLT
jgi:cation:H+ antiporter